MAIDSISNLQSVAERPETTRHTYSPGEQMPYSEHLKMYAPISPIVAAVGHGALKIADKAPDLRLTTAVTVIGALGMAKFSKYIDG